MLTRTDCIAMPTHPSFDISATHFAKGIATLLLLWCHLFYQHPEYGAIVHRTAIAGRVCVSIFVLLSGYGLYVSSASLRWWPFYSKRLRNLYASYWYVIAVFVPISVFVFDRGFTDVFPDHPFLRFGSQILGAQMYYGGYGFNPTWWFMSAIIPLYILFPLFCRIAERSEVFLLSIGLLAFWFGPGCFSPWTFVFVLGILAARHSLFERIAEATIHFCDRHHGILSFQVVAIACLALSAVATWLRQSGLYDAFLALLITYTSYALYLAFRRGSGVLVYIGKHSGNIFLTHTFLFYYFFADLFYSIPSPIAMLLALLVSSLAVSILLERLKSAVRQVVHQAVRPFRSLNATP